MPALPVIEDVFRCAIRSISAGSGYAYNVINVRATTLTQGQVGAALATLVANGDSPWTNAMANVASTQDVTVTPLDGVSSAITYPITGGAGANTSESLVASSLIVSLRTGLRGPRNRGRIYIPFTAETIVDGGYVNATPLGAIRTGMNAWLTELDTAGMQLVVASYKYGTYHLVESAIVEQLLATQRRRQDRLRG